MMTLGELEIILNNFPKSIDDAPIWGWGELTCWRGDYYHLTLTSSTQPKSIAAARQEVWDALNGKVFWGYKGGEFTMNSYTSIYGDEYGDYNGKVIEGIAFVFDENHKTNPYCKVLRG